MTLITGNTYPVRKQLKAMGGIWNKAKQGGLVPDSAADAADAAARLVGCAATNYREPAGFVPDWSDTAYEDQCAAACGFGL